MKLNISPFRIKGISIKQLQYFTLLLTITPPSFAFFPSAPTQLTLFNELGQLYFSTCPALVDLNAVPTSETLKQTFTLLNWNIYKQQNHQWSKELTQWAQKADLITLQEVKYNKSFIDFSKHQKLYYLQNYAFKYDGLIYGVNTLSRIQPAQVCGTRYLEPWLMIPKTGLASTYPIQDIEEKLLLINLHGVNFTFTATPLKQQMAPYLTLIHSHQGPVIISGDFNTWSDARTTEVLQSLIAAGFEETQFENDQRTLVLGRPLDHVFYRGLKVNKSQSMVTEASDHSPQLITFSLLNGQNYLAPSTKAG